MSSFAEEAHRSKTVAAINNTLGLDIPALNQFLIENYEMRISNGYGDLKGKTFRIATMGETNLEDVEELLSAIDKYIEKNH
jgi:aspartate aminotransferase-like enzyme